MFAAETLREILIDAKEKTSRAASIRRASASHFHSNSPPVGGENRTHSCLVFREIRVQGTVPFELSVSALPAFTLTTRALEEGIDHEGREMATTWRIGLVVAVIAALESMASPLPEQEHATAISSSASPPGKQRPLRDMRQFLVPFSVSFSRLSQRFRPRGLRPRGHLAQIHCSVEN